MKKEKGGVTYPLGFIAAGITCGIKHKNKDLGLLLSEVAGPTAAIFTTNKVKAAPVLLSKSKLKGKCQIQSIIANSGNANACTGEQGKKDAIETIKKTAGTLNIDEAKILIASTGPIGKYLPMQTVQTGITAAAANLSRKNGSDFAKSILTTDLVQKEIAVSFEIAGKKVRLGAAAKGSGMICPNMATMLCFITSDIDIELSTLKKALKKAVDQSFNKITVDGDMSTNDSVFFMTNGLAQNKKLTLSSRDYPVFQKALDQITQKLAKDIVRDGEGATKFIEINIKNAKNNTDAKKIAYSIANSPLVKTAIFGQNPNWGRIMAAIGYAEATINPAIIDIFFNNIQAVKNGITTTKSCIKTFKKKEIIITVDLKIAKGAYQVWTSDFSYDYVKINI